MDRVILHSDMNNFYASVECMLNPALHGRPVAVAGDPEQRHGIVLAKNQQAKLCGVQTGNPLWLARRLCPDIVFVPPHMDLYVEYAHAAREIYYAYTSQVEPFGLDECWLDVTGSAGLFGDGRTVADEIRARIKRELGVSVSIGVSFNKVFAKLGSDLHKPDATTVIGRAQMRQTVWPLPVESLLYVGRATHRRLRERGICTIGQLAAADPAELRRSFGKPGLTLWTFANGLDTSPVCEQGERAMVKSIGNSTTTPRDLTTDADIRLVIGLLAESVSARLRESSLICRTVVFQARAADLRWQERQGKLDIPCRTADAIRRKAYALYLDVCKPGARLRSIGVRATDLLPAEVEQPSFLPEYQAVQRREKLENTIDSIRSRFGHFSIQPAANLLDTQLSGLNPQAAIDPFTA